MRVFWFLLWLALFLYLIPNVAANDHSQLASEWQQRRLMQPTNAELHREQQSRVFMYDGLLVTDVENAMDKHFGRIQNMMFVRVQALEGEEYEDDGCD